MQESESTREREREREREIGRKWVREWVREIRDKRNSAICQDLAKKRNISSLSKESFSQFLCLKQKNFLESNECFFGIDNTMNLTITIFKINSSI